MACPNLRVALTRARQFVSEAQELLDGPDPTPEQAYIDDLLINAYMILGEILDPTGLDEHSTHVSKTWMRQPTRKNAKS